MDLLCLGDSLTYGYPGVPADSWPALVARHLGLTVTNRGVCGETTQDIRLRLPAALAELPGAVFLMGGSNDVLQDIALAETEKHMLAMIDMVQARALPLIVGIPPLTLAESVYFGWQAPAAVAAHQAALTAYGRWIKEEGGRRGLGIVDFAAVLAGSKGLYADGVHPNQRGYAAFAAAAIPVIADLTRREKGRRQRSDRVNHYVE